MFVINKLLFHSLMLNSDTIDIDEHFAVNNFCIKLLIPCKLQRVLIYS